MTHCDSRTNGVECQSDSPIPTVADSWQVHGAPSGGLALLEQLTDLPQQPVVLVVDSPNARRPGFKSVFSQAFECLSRWNGFRYWDVEDYKSHLKVWNATVEATIRESLTQGQQMLEKLRCWDRNCFSSLASDTIVELLTS